MYESMIKQFLRTKTCQLGLVLVLVLGVISIGTGKQFLDYQQKAATQAIHNQEEHLKRNIEYHGDDLGLLLYYLKFSLISQPKPLAALSIGQKDLNPSIQNVKILTLEGQKYDTDLVNPIKLLYGNLDLSFILVYIFPLLIIAFAYNLLSEEKEAGTWKMIRVTVKSQVKFLLLKLSVRFVFLLIIMCLVYLLAIWILNIPWNQTLLAFFIIGLLYQIFWFALSFFVISLQRHSNFNAVFLLASWLILVVLLPAIINNVVTNQYPVPEAFSTIIKQRDGYHQKWDTNKKETMDKFYKSYPELETFGYPHEEGFSWLWYYAMQHLGDDESREESLAMRDKIILRQKISKKVGQFFPTMHVLLTFNDLAETSLLHHIDFLGYTNEFHEDTRLYFYPKVFSQASSTDVDWSQFEPEFYSTKNQSIEWLQKIIPLVVLILFFAVLSILLCKRNFSIMDNH